MSFDFMQKESNILSTKLHEHHTKILFQLSYIIKHFTVKGKKMYMSSVLFLCRKK